MELRCHVTDLAIVTFAVDPRLVRPHVDPRFELALIKWPPLPAAALVSAVAFRCRRLCWGRMPWIHDSFNQVSYRCDVRDSRSGAATAWFLRLSSSARAGLLPRMLWRLPQRRAKIQLAREDMPGPGTEPSYTASLRANHDHLDMGIHESARPVAALEGFSTVGAGLDLIAMPTLGAYRRGEKTAQVRLTHSAMRPRVGRLLQFRSDFLTGLNIIGPVPFDQVHSVMLVREAELGITVPPRVLRR